MIDNKQFYHFHKLKNETVLFSICREFHIGSEVLPQTCYILMHESVLKGKIL